MKTRLLWAAVIVLVATLAIWLRVTQTYATSWAGDALVPYDTDPYYQLRRLELLRAGDFPPGVGDGFVNAPARFDCPWPVGLPVLLDGIVRVATIGRAPSRHTIEAIVAFAIPVLGALTPLLLMLVLARFGRAAAWLGGVAAAAIPSSRMAGHYARIDHHVLEPAAALGLYALVFAAPPRRRWRAALVAAVVGAACAFTLDLTFVFCAILGALAVGFALARRPLAVNAPAVVGLAAGIAAATLGDWALGAPRALGVDLRLAIAVAFAAAMLARRDGPRAIWLAGAAAVVYAAVRGASLGLWLTAPADPVTRTMEEALPGWTHVTLAEAAFHLVPMIVAVVVLGFDRARRDLRLLGFLVGLVLLDVAQAKYQALRALLEACGWALLPALVGRVVPAAWTLARRTLAPAVALAVVAGSAALLPPNPRLLQIAVARGLATLAELPGLADPAYATPRAQPASIVLAHPVDGVRFAYLAHVAVPSLPFWGQPTALAQFEETLALLRGPYDAALERRLDAWRVKYVLVTNPRPSLGLYEQLRIAAGSEHPGWPATATLRLVADAGTARLFERVRGARLHGRAPAGATVTVDAPVRTATATLRFRASATAGGDGTFALVFPYAGTVELGCPGGRRALAIPDAAVTHGDDVIADCAP